MRNIMKITGMVLLAVGLSSACFATPPSAPEIDPASCANALALLTGALLIVRGRRR